MKRIGITVKPNDPRASALLIDLCDWLTGKGIDVVLDSGCGAVGEPQASYLMPIAEMPDAVDLLIVLGGDGTLLHAGRHFIGSETPMLGINLGRLGFLTDTPVGDMFDVVYEVITGNIETKKHFSLIADVWRDGVVVARGRAMNDVVLERGGMPRMIGFELSVQNQFVFRMRGDGLILATPAGSTAYALSSGGPILHPLVDAISVVPVCPHTLSNRPIVVPAEDAIELHLTESKFDAALNLDGETLMQMREGDRVVVCKDGMISLVYPPGRNYFGVLRSKLGWAGQMERNPEHDQ